MTVIPGRDIGSNRNRGRLVEKATAISFEIQKFVKNHKVVNPLPRAKSNSIIPPFQVTTSSDYTEEEEDELAIYLAQTFPELSSLEGSDPASFLRDTVQFVVKANASMLLNEESSVEDVYKWLLEKGVSQEMSHIFKDNEIDGFSLINLTEEDIFRMLPGKVGPARKIITHLKKEQERLKDPKESKESSSHKEEKSNEYRGIIVEEVDLEIETTSNRDSHTLKECDEIIQEDSSNFQVQGARSQNQGYTDLCSFIPTYSPLIKELLRKGEIFKEWDKFIEETAYFILSRPAKFESRGMYADFGRLMYQRYPSIGHQAYGDPWGYFNKKLSQKIRNIRWRWNARGKSNPPVKKRKVEPEVRMVEEPMSLTDAGKIFRSEIEKPQKDVDRALILKALRGSFKERRTFITKKHDGNLKELLKKFPVLGKKEYVEKEFYMMKPNVKKDDIAENWTETLSHLDRVYGSEQQSEEEDDSVMCAAEEFRLMKKLEHSISYFHKGKSVKNPLMMTIKPADMKSLENKIGDPPRLIFVQGERGICNAYIIGGGIQMEVPQDLKDALTFLLFVYYVWDLAYPKYYQLLGFLQVYILKDKENKFAMSQNYLKFTKMFDDLK